MAKKHKHSWYFPLRNGGIDFVQDPSSAHFSDNPIPKLVRELIQNSLDARQSGRDRDPIIVTFTDTEVPKEIINAHQLSSHVAACRHRAKEQHHADVAQIYETALQTLRNVSIRCLRVTDASTTGLSESKWDALVLQEGAVQRPSHIGSPGGSYGIGKNAVFNVSDIQTVFYSTKYVDELKQGRVEKLQGKATLMSHPNPKKPVEPLQHIGFYMSSTKTPLLSSEIPAFFRLEETGTGVFIMGFNPRSDDWTRDVQMAVLENFFDAIHRKRLQVRVSSPDASDPIEITHETIDHLFNISSGARAPDAYHYYLATRDEESSTTPEIAQMGSLNVHVRTGSGPRRTAYVNRNGMLITASREQNVNPLSPRGKSLWPDYAAVVTPSTDAGDAWIRAMENPSHDSVSPGQLTDLSLATVAEHALRDARRAIREIIDHKSLLQNSGDLAVVDICLWLRGWKFTP